MGVRLNIPYQGSMPQKSHNVCPVRHLIDEGHVHDVRGQALRSMYDSRRRRVLLPQMIDMCSTASTRNVLLHVVLYI